MERKKILFGFAFLSVFIFCIALVSSAPSLISPATSSTISGATVLLNATNGTLTDMLNCTFYASSSLTANSTPVSIGVATNESVSAPSVNVTFDSSILEDANNYEIFASCWNSTTQENSSANTGITVDNTIPQAPTLSPSDLTLRTTSGTQTFTGTVVDENTTSCTYTIYRGGSPSDGNSGSGVYSGTSCTFTKTFSTSIDNGVWWWTVTASDETNTTSLTYKYNVNFPGSGGGLILPLTIAGDDGLFDGKGWSWLIGIVIVLGVIGLIYVFAKK